MAKYEYANDFNADLNEPPVEVPREPWQDQPITIPLSALRGMDLKLAQLEEEGASIRRMWAENNAKIRQLENENAKLKGDLDAMLAVDEWARVEE